MWRFYSDLFIHDYIIGRFFNVKAYLGIYSMKQVTNGIDHIAITDKYTP